VPLHLGAENELRLQFRDVSLDLQIIVGNERLDLIELGGVANLARVLA
jgi:hypothetical protein